MVAQVVEFSEANSQVSQDGELVTDVLYYVKSRGKRILRIKLPPPPVKLWEVSVSGQPENARQADDATLIPLPGGSDPNEPIEVRLRLGKPAVSESNPELALPVVYAPVLKTQWSVNADKEHALIPSGGNVDPPIPVLRPTAFEWIANRGARSVFLSVCVRVVWDLGNQAGRDAPPHWADKPCYCRCHRLFSQRSGPLMKSDRSRHCI